VPDTSKEKGGTALEDLLGQARAGRQHEQNGTLVVVLDCDNVRMNISAFDCKSITRPWSESYQTELFKDVAADKDIDQPFDEGWEVCAIVDDDRVHCHE
jgi:hypothetical protein